LVDDPLQTSTARRNPIAGIVNDAGKLCSAMMPHPENHVEAIMGCTDGPAVFFAGLVRGTCVKAANYCGDRVISTRPFLVV